MTAPSTAPATPDEIRLETISAVDALLRHAADLGLTDPPVALPRLRGRLAANQYNVMVAGEVKRGKSSFINALLARPLLPAATRVATNQVFRVSRGEREAYRVRYEDGTALEISPGDLARYGSQTEEDEPGERPIQWIEIDIPPGRLQMLPPDVSLIDTPGLGSLHPTHSVITQRFIPLADAVIYVLDSSAPMSQDDLGAIDLLLRTTPYIFFIQTKIDQRDQEDWQSVLRRNEEILRERFGERLPAARVWPVSNTLLLSAAASRGEFTPVVAARHQEMAAALRNFLFTAAGWSRCKDAVSLARTFHTQVQGILATRLHHSTLESKQALEQGRAEVETRRRQFNELWGIAGRQQLLRDLHQRLYDQKQIFHSQFEALSPLFRALQERIEEAETVEAANRIGRTLPDDVLIAVRQEWDRVSAQAIEECERVVRPFVTDALAIAPAAVEVSPDLRVKFTESKDGFLATVGAGRGEWMNITALTGIVVTVVSVAATPIAHVVAVGGAAAGIAAIKKSWEPARGKLLDAARANVIALLHNLRSQVYHYFFGIDPRRGPKSLVDAYFQEIEDALSQAIEERFRRRNEELAQEIAQIERTMSMDSGQRQEQIAEIRGRLVEWEKLAAPLVRINAALDTPPGGR